MILEGNERGYGADLAVHLMNPRDNDHVTIHAIDGFVADDLYGAFAEVDAISQATQCSKYLFSLSLNPPPGETVSVETFEAAIAAVEAKLGLVGQPRAIVFHEKNGRRHAHCVWSRIGAAEMKAITLSHYKRKLGDVGRELFRRHQWDMPEGFQDRAARDPLNVSREEAGQAKRLRRDPKTTKAMFRRCWEQSDSRSGFEAALKEDGFLLARGDRRGYVAVDADGKVWSLSRWCGIKAKELRERLGDEDDLPSIEAVLTQVQDLPRPERVQPDPRFDFQRSGLVARQRRERSALLKAQEERRNAEHRTRQARLPKGLGGVFQRITGRYTILLRQFEEEAEQGRRRDQAEQQALVEAHLAERRSLVRDAQQAGLAAAFRSSGVDTDPRQSFDAPSDELPFSTAELRRDPALILGHISRAKHRFKRADVLRDLVKRIDDPLVLKDLADKALRSSTLVTLEEGASPVFTTRDYLNAETRLQAVSLTMSQSHGFGVAKAHVSRAIDKQNTSMKRAFGGKLSKEQCKALDHVLGDRQLACVVGLAGAGKSTLLATAMDAWTRQGLTVHGAALSGKAADGLESASGISSRTLASLEASWENDYEPIGKGDILVIDEAGMIGTRQLDRITSRINDIGAKLVLVGDPDQLQPIEAGTPFRQLVKSLNTAELTEIHRQRDHWQKQASRDLASGNIQEAITAYQEHGAVKASETRDDAIEALVEAYAMDVTANGNATTRLAFAHRRKDVFRLNQAIRAAIRSGVEDAPAETLLQTETGKRAFANGDRIVFSRNDRDLGVRNGMLGTVQVVSKTSLAVTLDGDPPRTVAINPNTYRAFDHGYAVTVHKSQGATVDHAYVLASRSMDRHLAYVAMTRHRDQMRLYVNGKDRPAWLRRERGGFERTIADQRPANQRAGPGMG